MYHIKNLKCIRNFNRKPQRKSQLGRSRRTWEVILNGFLHKGVWECELGSCTEQIERLAFVNTAMNICFQLSAGHFVTSWATVSFSTWAVLLHDTTVWSAALTLRFHWQVDLRHGDYTTADQIRPGQTRQDTQTFRCGLYNAASTPTINNPMQIAPELNLLCRVATFCYAENEVKTQEDKCSASGALTVPSVRGRCNWARAIRHWPNSTTDCTKKLFQCYTHHCLVTNNIGQEEAVEYSKMEGLRKSTRIISTLFVTELWNRHGAHACIQSPRC